MIYNVLFLLYLFQHSSNYNFVCQDDLRQNTMEFVLVLGSFQVNHGYTSPALDER